MAQSPAGQPAPHPVSSPFSRRTLLRGALGGVGAVTLPMLLAACGDDDGAGGGSGAKTVSVGSNASDAVPKKAYEEAFAAYQSKSGAKVNVNTIEHNTFQQNINRYLQGNPEDVFMWFAGYRMQFFAKKGFLGDITDLWSGFDGFSDALKQQSTGEDGKQYFVPFYYYPWAVFYRKSLWQERGYTAPKTLDEYTKLAQQMQKDKLVPIGLGDKDGWPAMGTFDYFNLRTNGYQFHADLMAGKEAWTDARVKKAFDLWRGLMPLHEPGALGRTWQEAAQNLYKKQTGMIVFGTPHPGTQFPKEEHDDIGFFPFPEIDPAHGQKAVEAPIDGFLLSKKAKNPEAGKELLKWLATPEAETFYLKADPSNVGVHEKVDASQYSQLQKDSAKLVTEAESIAQFLDRDTRPDFAQTVMIKAIQDFIKNPNDIDGLVNSIENQKKRIFASD